VLNAESLDPYHHPVVALSTIKLSEVSRNPHFFESKGENREKMLNFTPITRKPQKHVPCGP